MKNLKPILTAVLLTGALGASAAPAEPRDIVSKVELVSAGYCHLKFPAIRERTLGWSRPVLKDADSGDIIDFYGPCDHDPLGPEEIRAQRLDHWRRSIIHRE